MRQSLATETRGPQLDSSANQPKVSRDWLPEGIEREDVGDSGSNATALSPTASDDSWAQSRRLNVGTMPQSNGIETR